MTGRMYLLAICVVVCALFVPSTKAAAAPIAVVRVKYFTLDKVEAAKGEQVVVRWLFTGNARRVSISTAAEDGILLPYVWQVTPTNTGVLTFTVPFSLYTLSPLFVALNVDGQLLNSVPLLIRCDNSWFFTPRAERCPDMPITPSAAAMEEFEHGRMIWLQDWDSVFVFYNDDTEVVSMLAGRWERFEDKFNEGDLETDPAFTPPAGKVQPKRGFGLVWRMQRHVRDALGWGLSAERGYTACMGGGFGGWKSFVSYLSDANGKIMQLNTYYMPTTWRMVDGVTFTGCGA